MNRRFSCIRKFIFIIFVAIGFGSHAQIQLNDIDSNRIKQKTIRLFLKDQIRKGIVSFEDFQPSVDENTDSSKFDYNCHRFSLRQAQATLRQAQATLRRDLPVIWNAYLTAHPAQIWQGKVVSCGFIYSPQSKRAIFPDDSYPGLEQGQIFFIEMRVLCGLIKFPVCFMITKIDESKHAITFSYVLSGSSKGAQTIRLIGNGKSETIIIHSSIHKTENVVRDKTLYPIYHKKAIKEVHRNIQRLFSY